MKKSGGQFNSQSNEQQCDSNSGIPEEQYISCSEAMLILGFCEYDEFCDFAANYLNEIMQLPYSTRELLIFNDEEDWYHRDIIILLQSKLHESAQ